MMKIAIRLTLNYNLQLKHYKGTQEGSLNSFTDFHCSNIKHIAVTIPHFSISIGFKSDAMIWGFIIRYFPISLGFKSEANI